MNLQQELKDACEQHGTVHFRNDYSGRGMYGRSCVGITGSSDDCHMIIGEVIKNLADRLVRVAKESMDADYSATDDDLIITQEKFADNVDILMGHSYDNMGMDVIIYWPALQSIQED